MNDWINLTALWQIVVVGLIAGAGLPALFAIGMRLFSLPGGARTQAAGAGAGAGAGPGAGPGAASGTPGDSDSLIGGNAPAMLAGALCFLIVLAAIGWGIWAIYQAGHPKH
jgi:hypothetical protein